MTLAQLFIYEPESGRLLWRQTRRGGREPAGSEAGSVGHHGYRSVHVAGKRHYVHRVVWEIANGPIPADKCVDHIDGDTGNNRLCNLRLVTRAENQRNRRRNRNNTTGVIGVTAHRGGYSVYCSSRYVGYSKSLDEAIAMRRAAEQQDGYSKRGHK